MLWYKNWLEIRWGVLYILLYWILLSVLFYILARLGVDCSILNHTAIYGFLISVACLGFVFLAGSGVETYMLGLKTLPNARTSVFTLSLPVTRQRLVLTRSAIGLFAVIFINLPFELLVWYLMGGNAPFFDLSIPFLEVTIFGICMYCLVTLLSTFVRGGLIFPLACSIVFFCLGVATGDWAPPALQIINIDVPSINVRTAAPWLPITVYLVLSVIFLFTAVKVVELRDY